MFWAFPDGTGGKEPACQCRRHKRSKFDPWVRKISWWRVLAIHSSSLVCRIPWTEEPGGLQSIGPQRVRHNWSDWAGMHVLLYGYTGICWSNLQMIDICLPSTFRVLWLYCYKQIQFIYMSLWASHVVLVIKNPPDNAGDIRPAGSILGLGRSPGERHSNPF